MRDWVEGRRGGGGYREVRDSVEGRSEGKRQCGGKERREGLQRGGEGQGGGKERREGLQRGGEGQCGGKERREE